MNPIPTKSIIHSSKMKAKSLFDSQIKTLQLIHSMFHTHSIQTKPITISDDSPILEIEQYIPEYDKTYHFTVKCHHNKRNDKLTHIICHHNANDQDELIHSYGNLQMCGYIPLSCIIPLYDLIIPLLFNSWHQNMIAKDVIDTFKTNLAKITLKLETNKINQEWKMQAWNEKNTRGEVK